MFITAQGCRLRNNLYCVEWDVKLYYTYTESHVTRGTSVPILVFLGLSVLDLGPMNVTDRQTDVK